MKKISKYLLILFSLSLAFSCSSYYETTSDGFNVKEGYNEEKSYIKEIDNINNFIKLYNDDKMSVIVIGQTECTHCISFKPSVNKVSYTTGYTIYWMEYDLLDGNAKYKFQNLDEKFKEFGTPYTVFVKKGKIVDELSGDVGASKLYKKLQTNKLVK